MARVRLHKAIADSGLASRRAAEEMIRQGRVMVNGEIVTAMGVSVDPRTDSITVDGSHLGRADRKKTYLFYKPPGFICTRDDPHGRSTVFDILPDEVGTGLHTAGRLDMDAEGALILTNDGELTRTLTHPSSHLPKTYLVKVKGEVLLRGLKKLRRGVELEDGVTLPASVSVLKGKGTERNTWLRIILKEGRKNQIKRMCEAVGHRVLSIKRISIGGMVLPDRMKPGSFKKLSKKEIETMVGGRDRAAQRPSSFAKATTDRKPKVQSPSSIAPGAMEDRKSRGQRVDTGSRSRGAEDEGTQKRHGWASKSQKPKGPGGKPGEKDRRGGRR
jgi:pseudouridine synthase